LFSIETFFAMNVLSLYYAYKIVSIKIIHFKFFLFLTVPQNKIDLLNYSVMVVFSKNPPSRIIIKKI